METSPAIVCGVPAPHIRSKSFVAIFGSLSKFSLREIISVVGKRRGSLVIEMGGAGGMRLRLRVKDEQVTQFTLERAVLSADEIRLLLKRAVSSHGAFRFDENALPQPEPNTGTALTLGWDELLGYVDDAQEHGDLPHPQTRFTMLKGRTASFEPELEQFLRASRTLLEAGTCAAEISEKLGMELEHVQRQLHRLRELKKIWPVRAYAAQPPGQAQQQENALIANRLTGHLES